MKKALALCGGGSLGAYEMGVWKYFREHGFDFDIITGTSIGAINGAMIAADRFDEAMDLWDTIRVSDIMTNGIDFDRNFLKNIDVTRDSNWSKFVSGFRQNKGADTAPLMKMLEERILPLRVNHSKKQFGVVVCRFPSFKEEDILVNDLRDDQVVDYIMASASCWPVFPVYEIRGVEYVDGGWRNNLPIDFALRLGADEVVAVLLNSLPHAQRRELFDLPNVTLIQPSLSQGSFLAFTHSAIESNIQLGYLDAGKTFGTYSGNRVTLERTSGLKTYAQRYYHLFMEEDPNDYLALAKYQAKRKLLKIQDPIEACFIYSLERMMDLFDLDFRRLQTVEDLMIDIKRKINEEPTLTKERQHFMKITSKDSIPLTIANKELFYFGLLLK